MEDARGCPPFHQTIPERVSRFKNYLRFDLDFCRNVGRSTRFDSVFASNMYLHFDSYERNKLFSIVLEHSTDMSIMFKYISILARSIGMKSGETSDDFLNSIEQIPNLSEILRSTEHFNYKRSVMQYLVPIIYPENDRLLLSLHHFINNVEVLLKKGCELDHQDINKRTVFHYAVYFKQPLIIEALIKLGADVNITDSVGLTPYAYYYQTCKWDEWDEYHGYKNSMIRTLETHMERLHAAGLYMNEINETHYRANLERDYCRIDHYKSELNAMDRKEVHKSISVRTLLTENFVTSFPISSRLKRIHIRKYLNSDQLYEDYPDWSPYFKLQSRKIKISEELFEPAFDALKNVLNFNLPDHCLESILESLTIYDWKKICKS